MDKLFATLLFLLLGLNNAYGVDTINAGEDKRQLTHAKQYIHDRDSIDNHIEDLNKNLVLPLTKEIKSYIPRWVIEQKDGSKIFLIFDDKYVFKADFQIIGFSFQFGNGFSHARDLLGSSSNEHLIYNSKLLANNNELMKVKTFEDALLTVKKSATLVPQTQAAIVRLESDGLFYINVTNFEYIDDLSKTDKDRIDYALCANVSTQRKPKKCDGLNDSLIKSLAIEAANNAIGIGDYRALIRCKYRYGNKFTYDQQCHIPLQIGYAEESKSAERQLWAKGVYTSDYLLLKLGYFELIGWHNWEFSYAYNAEMVKRLYEKGLLKTDVYTNRGKRDARYEIVRNWTGPALALPVLLLCVIIYFLTKRRGLFILSFGITQLIFYAPVPDPFVGISIVDLTPYLIISMTEFRGLTIVMCTVFVVYWLAVHAIIKKLR